MSSQRPTDELDNQDVTFAGEQDGAVERQLKDKLAEVLRRDATVTRAYLARATVGGNATVVLALRADGAAERVLAGQVGTAFASMFDSAQHLDVVFVDAERERDVRRVCRAFYERMKK